MASTPSKSFDKPLGELAARVAELEAQLHEQENSKRIQKALFEIAYLAFNAKNLDQLLKQAHDIVAQFMYAKNFFVALEDKANKTLYFPYYLDSSESDKAQDVTPIPLEQISHSLTAHIIRHNDTVFLTTSDEFEEFLVVNDLRLVGNRPHCFIGVPLQRNGKPSGALAVQSYDPNVIFTESDKEILTFLSQHIATVLDKFQGREELEQLVQDRTRTMRERNVQLQEIISERDLDRKTQEVIYEISQITYEDIPLKSLYRKVHTSVGKLFYAQNFCIATFDDIKNTIDLVYLADQKGTEVRSRKLGNGATEYVMHQLLPMLLQRSDLQTLIENGEIDVHGHLPESWMGAPILIDNACYGVIIVQSYDANFIYSERELDLMRFIAEQISNSVKRASDSDALMLANITLEARVEQRTHELSLINSQLGTEIEERRHAEELQKTLFEIDEVTHSTQDLALMYQRIHQLVGRLMNAEHFFIAEYNKVNGNLYVPYYVDDTQPLADFTEFTAADPIPHLAFEEIDKTLTGYVIRTGQSLLATREICDQLISSGEINAVGVDAIDWLGVPMAREGAVVGAIVVQTYDEGQRYGQTEKELLQFVSSHITTALERKQYQRKLELRVEERTNELGLANSQLQQEIAVRQRAENLQAALFKIADMTNSTSDMQTFYKRIHEIIGELIYAKHFFIAIPDEQDPELLTFPYYIDRQGFLPKSRPMGNNLTEEVIRTGRPLLLNPENRQQLLKNLTIFGTKPVSWLGVPMLLENEVLGAIVVQTYDDAFFLGAHEEELLTFVSQHVATALGRKRVRDELERRVEQRTIELRSVNESLEQQIEKREVIEKKLEFDAFHDALTKLPNRALFMDRLAHLIAKGSRSASFKYAVFFLDLDRFKIVNDSLGHLAGDKLLQKVSERLCDLVRPQDTVARLGGDEFCILLDDVHGLTFAKQIAERICAELTLPFDIHGNEVFTSTSLGIAYSSLRYENPDMLRDADAAMYQAKLLGKRQYSVFDKSMHAKAMKTLKLESELRNAIKQDEIEVFYQPIINLADGSIDGFEALARWRHPEQGLIPPADFIPMAEESGLITELDLAVCNIACKQMANWNDKFQSAFTISVNLSSKHFSRTDLVGQIRQVIEYSNIVPSCLKLEVTESAIMENVAAAQAILLNLKKLGVLLAMDDFGTGYSSLSYLHRFPFDVLKVDRCFVDEVDIKNENRAIVSTIVTLARSLNMVSVAEGIETSEQHQVVSQLGCNLGQGFLFAKPLVHNKVEKFISEQLELNGNNFIAQP